MPRKLIYDNINVNFCNCLVENAYESEQLCDLLGNLKMLLGTEERLVLRPMFGFGKKKETAMSSVTSVKKDDRASVFVDFEYWNTNLQSRYSVKPQVAEWLAEIPAIKQGFIFGDMDETEFLVTLPAEVRTNLSVVRQKTNDKGSRKGEGTIAMLSAVYQALVDGSLTDHVVLFAGDGNFETLIGTLKKNGKQVTLYTVRGVTAENIKDVADTYIELPVKKESGKSSSKSRVYETMILKSLSHLAAGDKMATYGKTIANVAKHNHVPNKRIQATLDELIEKGYISLEETEYEDKKVPVLHADWEKLDADKVWEKRF